MEHIETITVRQALPMVFAGQSFPHSRVWLSELTLHRGDLYKIEAASGGGKSSLCAYIYGSREDYQGEILFNNEDIRTFDIARWQEIRRKHLAYLPQDLSLFPELTAIENIQLKNRLTDFATESEILGWLHRLGIEFRANFPCGRMSIGQQQRVAIVRAICQPFDFILLDEPVSHLDSENNLIAASLIEEIASRQNAAVISTSVGNPLALSAPISLPL